jgi:hypothetical protein
MKKMLVVRIQLYPSFIGRGNSSDNKKEQKKSEVFQRNEILNPGQFPYE